MPFKEAPHFIIIDDDKDNNRFSEMLLRSSPVRAYVGVQCFTKGEEALEYLSNNYNDIIKFSTVLLLDINIISMTAWDFLEKFTVLDPNVKDFFKIYLLSSSADPADKQRALNNEYITDYIQKPLTVKVVNRILEQL